MFVMWSVIGLDLLVGNGWYFSIGATSRRVGMRASIDQGKVRLSRFGSGCGEIGVATRRATKVHCRATHEEYNDVDAPISPQDESNGLNQTFSSYLLRKMDRVRRIYRCMRCATPAPHPDATDAVDSPVVPSRTAMAHRRRDRAPPDARGWAKSMPACRPNAAESVDASARRGCVRSAGAG